MSDNVLENPFEPVLSESGEHRPGSIRWTKEMIFVIIAHHDKEDLISHLQAVVEATGKTFKQTSTIDQYVRRVRTWAYSIAEKDKAFRAVGGNFTSPILQNQTLTPVQERAYAEYEEAFASDFKTIAKRLTFPEKREIVDFGLRIVKRELMSREVETKVQEELVGQVHRALPEGTASTMTTPITSLSNSDEAENDETMSMQSSGSSTQKRAKLTKGDPHSSENAIDLTTRSVSTEGENELKVLKDTIISSIAENQRRFKVLMDVVDSTHNQLDIMSKFADHGTQNKDLVKNIALDLVNDQNKILSEMCNRIVLELVCRQTKSVSEFCNIVTASLKDTILAMSESQKRTPPN